MATDRQSSASNANQQSSLSAKCNRARCRPGGHVCQLAFARASASELAFAPGEDGTPGEGETRRGFLKLMGASLALAGAAPPAAETPSSASAADAEKDESDAVKAEYIKRTEPETVRAVGFLLGLLRSSPTPCMQPISHVHATNK